MALRAPKNEEFGGLIPVLEDQFPAHFTTGIFGQHHYVWGIAQGAR